MDYYQELSNEELVAVFREADKATNNSNNISEGIWIAYQIVCTAMRSRGLDPADYRQQN